MSQKDLIIVKTVSPQLNQKIHIGVEKYYELLRALKL